jgi:hypothetical protein
LAPLLTVADVPSVQWMVDVPSWLSVTLHDVPLTPASPLAPFLPGEPLLPEHPAASATAVKALNPISFLHTPIKLLRLADMSASSNANCDSHQLQTVATDSHHRTLCMSATD